MYDLNIEKILVAVNLHREKDTKAAVKSTNATNITNTKVCNKEDKDIKLGLTTARNDGYETVITEAYDTNTNREENITQKDEANNIVQNNTNNIAGNEDLNNYAGCSAQNKIPGTDHIDNNNAKYITQNVGDENDIAESNNQDIAGDNTLQMAQNDEPNNARINEQDIASNEARDVAPNDRNDVNAGNPDNGTSLERNNPPNFNYNNRLVINGNRNGISNVIQNVIIRAANEHRNYQNVAPRAPDNLPNNNIRDGDNELPDYESDDELLIVNPRNRDNIHPRYLFRRPFLQIRLQDLESSDDDSTDTNSL
ncbi:unnamed protein product [Parnassius mnemosyne]|uniref:Uncharacterized protein n=1 Tax=Parnassius mnemosyne TaxID=213953 RepID=A0AAV1L0F3_9NEOP